MLLIKALYGHPDAGGLWEAHLQRVLHNLGGSEVVEFPGNFPFIFCRCLASFEELDAGDSHQLSEVDTDTRFLGLGAHVGMLPHGFEVPCPCVL